MSLSFQILLRDIDRGQAGFIYHDSDANEQA
jgi:hypothetical protein